MIMRVEASPGPRLATRRVPASQAIPGQNTIYGDLSREEVGGAESEGEAEARTWGWGLRG